MLNLPNLLTISRILVIPVVIALLLLPGAELLPALDIPPTLAQPEVDADNASPWPDLVLIDGGLGQLNAARATLAELGVTDVPLVSIAKGEERNACEETFFMTDRPPLKLRPRDPVLYFVQRLRDEAHRFAIGAHRTRRAIAIGRSPLDEIAGIGARRKKALLHRLGSARAVARAGLADLEQVEGISRTVARKIYEHFHENR